MRRVALSIICGVILLGNGPDNRFMWSIDNAGLIHIIPFPGERVNPKAQRKINEINHIIASRR